MSRPTRPVVLLPLGYRNAHPTPAVMTNLIAALSLPAEKATVPYCWSAPVGGARSLMHAAPPELDEITPSPC